MVTSQVLLLVLLLQVKHLVADFFLQNRYMLENRRIYGHPGGLMHVAIHLAGSVLALLVVGVSPVTLGVLILAEGLVHYHMDWAKDNFVAWRGLTPRDALFWHATGVDQAVHHLTYLGMAAGWALLA
jgi:hypothetical protein